MNSETARVHGALMTVSLIYGYFYVAVKLLLKIITPSEFILLRFALTTLFVIVIDRVFFRQPLPERRDWPKIAGLGLVGVFLVQILVVVGLHHTTAFHSSLIMATIPIITLILSILGGLEKFHYQKLMGIITGFAGVSVLLFLSAAPGTPLPPTYILGDLIVLLNAIAFSWFLLGSHKILQQYRAFPFMSYCYIVSAGLFIALFVGEGWVTGRTLESFMFLFRMNPVHWLLMMYVVLFASIGSYTLNNYALQRTSTTTVAVYLFIQPVISAVTAYYLLGEPLNAPMIIAALMIFAGIMMVSTVGGKARRIEDPGLSPAPLTSDPEEQSASSLRTGGVSSNLPKDL